MAMQQPQGKAQSQAQPQQPQGKGQAQSAAPQAPQGKAGAQASGQPNTQPQGGAPSMIQLIGHMLQGGGGQPVQGGGQSAAAPPTPTQTPAGTRTLGGGSQVPGFPTWNPDAQGHMGGAGEMSNPNNGGSGIGSAQAPSTARGGMGTGT